MPTPSISRLLSTLRSIRELTPSRTSTPLPYPLPTSFPHIYDRTSAALSVRAALSTDTGVAARIRSLRTVVGRAVGVEEREPLGNVLGEMAEGYEEGWSSGSDEDED